PEAMMSSLFCGVRYLSSTSRLPCAANAAVRTSIQNASGGSPAAKAVASFWWYSLKGNASRCTAMVGLAFAYSCSSASIAASRAGSADIQNRRVMGPPPRTSLSLFLAGGVKDSSHCVSSPCVRSWREESHEDLHGWTALHTVSPRLYRAKRSAPQRSRIHLLRAPRARCHAGD